MHESEVERVHSQFVPSCATRGKQTSIQPPCGAWLLGGLETGEAGEITIVTGEEMGPLSLSPVGGARIDRLL